MNNTKAWYLSKTLWLNVIAVLALLLQTRFGFVIDPETQTALLAVVNVILRAITRQPLEWKTTADDSEPPHFIPPAGSAGFARLSLLPVLVLVAALALASLPGCAAKGTPAAGGTMIDNESAHTLAGKSLLAVKSTILASAQTVATLCQAGTLDLDTCRRAQEAYDLAKPAYDSAVDSYLLSLSEPGNKKQFDEALTRAQSLAANLMTLTGGLK